MTTQQPEALRLAELLELAPEDGIEPQTSEDAAAELLRQHARIADLEAQLASIGAGGVNGPLMGRTDSKERAGRFTKKPVTIDAWLIDFGNKPLPDWVNEAFRAEAIDWCPSGEGLYINTLEGHMLGANGSWLIKGVQGELYACKPDIFAATYERASLAASAGSEPVAVGLSDPFDALRWGANVAETLLSIGRAIGFGRAQQILGEQWEAAHDCAPRGRMGVTVKDEATCQMCGGKPYPGCNTEFQGEAACRFTHPSPPEGAGSKNGGTND